MSNGHVMRSPRRGGGLGLVALALLLLAGLASPLGAQAPAAPPETCSECHPELRGALARMRPHAESVTCLSCHHVGFTSDPARAAARRLEACGNCHGRLAIAHGDPKRPPATCTQCHEIHAETTSTTAAASARCQACHERPHALHADVREGGPACRACHEAHSAQPPASLAARVSGTCASCHPSPHASHAAAAQGGAGCTTCHGLSSDPAAAAPPAGERLGEVCASCHQAVGPTHAAAGAGAPGCADCHSYAGDPPFPAAAAAVSERCGACHAEAKEGYARGAHGRRAGKDAGGGRPTCVTCHGAHAGAGTGQDGIRRAATERCIDCHSDEALARKYGLAVTVGDSYVQDFHGATLQFRSRRPGQATHPEVMTCSDCHGAHAVSRGSTAALGAVCGRCHEGRDSSLAGAWLGHTPPGPRNRPVVWLVRLSYSLLIPFVLIGLALNIVFHFVDQRRKGARILETHGMKRLRARLAGKREPEPATVRRFTRLERLEHLGSMLTFGLLVATGLPQTRPDIGAAHAVIGLFGGIDTARLLHRVAGFIFAGLLLLHVARAILRALRNRRLPVMVPDAKDFRDAFEMLRHYLTGAPRPGMRKFDFSHKFEYWGLFLGGTLMSVTGLVLVYPELVTQVLPGILVATFRVMHGLEATFAVLVIAIWHSYGVIFRPEIFPLDTSIFTGMMSVERLREEHQLEYERLFPEGQRETPAHAHVEG